MNHHKTAEELIAITNREDFERMKESLILRREDPNYTYDQLLRTKVYIYREALVDMINSHEQAVKREQMLRNLWYVMQYQSLLDDKKDELRIVDEFIINRWGQ